MGKKMYQIEEIRNKILQGDTLLALKKIPDESIDMVITSPPYHGLRDYQTEGQIGLEKTFKDFLDKIIEVMWEIKRVVKKTGQIWVNFGDSYGGSPAEGKSVSEAKNFAFATDNERMFSGKSNNSRLKHATKQKCLLMQPERFAIRCIDEVGLILRNKIKWAKKILVKKENRTIGSAMPSSAKDRFNESGEELYFFSKSKEKSSDIKKWLEKPLKEVDRAWLAAMVDGEGSIYIHRSKRKQNHDVFGAMLTVCNSCKEIIDKCFKIAGVGKIYKMKQKTNFQMYKWIASHNTAVAIIGEIYPYLIQKREQAKVAIALQKTNKYRGNNKGENFGPKPISEKEYQQKVQLWELSKKINQREVKISGLPEPNLNKSSGCERYWSDLDAVRLPPQTFENRPDGFTRSREYQYNSKFLQDYSSMNKQSGQRFNYRVRDAIRKKEQPQFRATKKEIKGYQGKFAGRKDAEMFNSPRARMQRNSECAAANMQKYKYAPADGRGEDAKTEKNYGVKNWHKKKYGDDGGLGKSPPTIWQIEENWTTNQWQINPEPHNFSKELGVDTEHFAAFPQALLEIPIKFGCPRWICKKCGKPRDMKIEYQTTGWTDCGCNAGWKPGIVLDPFCGVSTTGLVALKLGRDYIGIEINKDYCEMGKKRVEREVGTLFHKVEIKDI